MVFSREQMTQEELMSFLQSGKRERLQGGYIPGTPLLLIGYLNGALPKERGAARLYETEEMICAEGLFFDSDLFNLAQKDNDLTWTLGDVFEWMLQLPGHEDYYEFHSTPEGIRLQLHIMDYRTFRSVPHEQKICDRGLQVKNEYDSEKQLWLSRLQVPKKALRIPSLAGCSFVMMRQNYTHGEEKPEISATQVFPRTVHFPSLWHKVKQTYT